MAEGSQVQSAREPRDVLKTAGSQGRIRFSHATDANPESPKPTCFNLPDHQFSYGRPGNQDSEGAREVSMRWVGHTRSKRMQAEEPDFMSVNRTMGLTQIQDDLGRSEDPGAVLSNDLRQYFRQVPDPPRLSGRKGNPGKPLIPSDVIPGFAYGRKVRPSTPIQEACIQQRRIQDRGQTECCVPSDQTESKDFKDPNLNALVIFGDEVKQLSLLATDRMVNGFWSLKRRSTWLNEEACLSSRQVEILKTQIQDQASAPAGIAVADAARGSPAFLEICRPSCRGEDRLEGEEPKGDRSECGGSVEGEEFQAVLQPPLEKALPPAQRYSAMLQRVAQLGAAVVSEVPSSLTMLQDCAR
eukprot:s1998_g10.t1